MIENINVSVGDGHGIDTPGKRTPDQYKENYFNNAVKVLLIQLLKARGINVNDVSPESVDTPLSERVKRANEAKSNIYISIHYNAYGNDWNGAEGVETIYYKNSAHGKLLASCIQRNLIKGTKQVDRGIKSTETLYILKFSTMPTVLIEAGFMTNKREAKLMQDVNFRMETAYEIYKGILEYFGIKDEYYRVITGSFSNKDNAQKRLQELEESGIKSFIAKYEI